MEEGLVRSHGIESSVVRMGVSKNDITTQGYHIRKTKQNDLPHEASVKSISTRAKVTANKDKVESEHAVRPWRQLGPVKVRNCVGCFDHGNRIFCVERSLRGRAIIGMLDMRADLGGVDFASHFVQGE